MIDCLQDKFGDNESPQYYFQGDKLADFEIRKEKSKFKFFETIPVISYYPSFQVTWFSKIIQ